MNLTWKFMNLTHMHHMFSPAGFVVPGWGAVAVWNPPNTANPPPAAAVTDSASSEGGEGVRGPSALRDADIRALSAVWTAQVRVLFGLPERPSADIGVGAVEAVAPPSGVAEWEARSPLRICSDPHPSCQQAIRLDKARRVGIP